MIGTQMITVIAGLIRNPLKIREILAFARMTVIICVICVLNISTGKASENPFYFNRLSIQNGLSNDRVYAVLQDRRGFLWVGTTDGLNRFDGVAFKTFYKYDLDVNSSYIISLCEDNQGNIYIGTDNGISVYNLHSDTFQHIEKIAGSPLKIRNKVSVIKKDEEGVIWMTVDKQGIFSFNPKNRELKNYLVENNVSPVVSGVSCFHFDKSHPNLISFYFDNLYFTDKSFKKQEPYTLPDGSQPYKRDNIIRIIRGANSNTLYVASVNKGVCEINLSTHTMEVICSDNNGKSIPNDLYLDANNTLWIATTNGVYQYNIRTENLTHIEVVDNKLASLSDLEVMAILIDDIKGIWLGSFNHGLLHTNKTFIQFEKFYQTPSASLVGKTIREFEEDKDGNIWIGTRRSGLFKYNPQNKELEKYKKNSLPETIFGLCRDDNHLWMSSYDGIYRLNIKSGQVKIYNRRDHGSKLRDDRTTKIYKNSQNQILVGSALGLLQYDTTKDEFIAIDSFNGIFVDDILEDSRGNMWYATYANGLYKYDRIHRQFTNYKNDPDKTSSIPCNKVISLFEDSKQRIWITTFGGGFCRLNNDETFTVFDISNGMPSNIIYKIIEDDNGWFWVSSGQGLIKFQPETAEKKVYTTADGLLDDEFNFLSGIKTANGNILFGSQDGFIQFNPKNFISNQKMPNIVITDLLINNQLVKANEKHSPLQCGIADTREIKLSAYQNTLELRCSILNFHSPLNNLLYYKLEGENDQWQKMSSEHRLVFNKLAPGKYTLYLMGVNSDGVQNNEHPPLHIVILPKFYQSTTAIVIYIILTIIALSLFFYFLWKRTLAQQHRRQHIFEKNKEIELYNEKIEFFSNIAHEIKTPLTLIRTPLEHIMNHIGDFNREINEDLNLISRNAQLLSQLINELLDFSKIEKQGFQLSCVELDIVEKIEFLKYNFTAAATNKNLEITSHYSNENIYVFADERGIEKIFNNLFSNALKYAETYISLSVETNNESVIVSVKNDGPIIPIEKRQSIFDPFVQYHDPEKIYTQGFGIGLSLAKTIAELHSGTLTIDDDLSCNNFILTLPLHEKSTENKPEEEEIPVAENKPHVLLVEDNVELLAYIERKLKKNYRIQTATNGEMALEFINTQPVDIIVSDISMPKMDGLEMCLQLKKNFETSHIPIIVLSAHSSMRAKVASMEYGADMYIEKPFSMEFLISCIERLLDKRKQLVHLYKSVVNPSPKESDLSGRDKKFLLELDEIILKNLSDPDFSNEQLAGHLNISKPTLNRKIKGLLNTTPNEYIQTKRIIMAAKLLVEGSYRINETCYQVGFNTPSYFIKCFKNYFGKTPTEYIQQNK
ncbi:hybrid sensor histidine kinase/response regulator [Bacteroidia bacterium]|nr:hybrid sensor histidine kinase/response regulator [Bacteroidia bacterium]